jgi:hypothetical protein
MYSGYNGISTCKRISALTFKGLSKIVKTIYPVFILFLEIPSVNNRFNKAFLEFLYAYIKVVVSPSTNPIGDYWSCISPYTSMIVIGHSLLY